MENGTLLSSLVYLERDGKYLMLHRTKKERDCNAGKWIGVGGKFEKDESPDECAAREVREETGLSVRNLRFRGIVTFVNTTAPTEYMHLFTGEEWDGDLSDCPEGDLRWIEKEKVPSLNLWEGDRIFLRLLREGAPFFSLKLIYEDDRLVTAELNGNGIPLG